MNNTNVRLVQIFDEKLGEWTHVQPMDVKKGDKFRMYEPDMTPVIDPATGLHEHVALSDTYFDPLGRYTVQFIADE